RPVVVVLQVRDGQRDVGLGEIRVKGDGALGGARDLLVARAGRVLPLADPSRMAVGEPRPGGRIVWVDEQRLLEEQYRLIEVRRRSPDLRTLTSSTCVTARARAISPTVFALPLNENEEVRAGTRRSGILVRTSINSSARPSEKYS